MAISPDGMPSMAILPPWLMFWIMSRKAWGLPDISRPTSKPSVMWRSAWTSLSEPWVGSKARLTPTFSGECAAVGVGVGDDDVAGRRRGGLRRPAMMPMGAGAGDEDVFAEHGKGERGVDGVAEGVEDAGDLGGDVGGVVPDVLTWAGRCTGRSSRRGRRLRRGYGRRGGGVRRGSCGSVPQTTWPSPETSCPGWTSGTLAPTSTTSPTNSLTDDEADGGQFYLAHCVPVVDVEIGAADAGEQNADLDVVDADFGLGYILEP